MDRLLIFDKNMKMADVLLQNHFLLLVLERFEINLGLQDKTISEVCNENNVNHNVFFAIANLHKDINSLTSVNFNDEDIVGIIAYLKKSHEYYITETLPEISQKIKTLCENHNELVFILIERFFSEYKNEVNNHLKYEEKIVYPYSLSLLILNNYPDKYSIAEYKYHHDDIETKLDDLKNLLIKHLPEKNDQKFRRTILFDLFRFEKDLKIHTVIEEKILIPYIENIENKRKS